MHHATRTPACREGRRNPHRRPRVRIALALGAAWLQLAAPGATAFELATESEALASRRAEAPEPRGGVRLRSLDFSAPRIEVLRPDLQHADSPLSSPLPVEVRFYASGDARIVSDSFRAYYGFFKLDVTERLLAHATVTDTGIRVEDAELPSGSHRLLLRIEDDAARVGEREIRFVVAD